MLRNLSSLQDRAFDLLVAGGGVVGACVAWDAAQRGLSVALVERRDFGSGTSSNSLKILHGGLRYLQRLDLRGMRESIRERRTWLRIAPHLVEPLPVVVPDYGERRENRSLLRTALVLNDLLSADRNRDLAADRVLPGGTLLSSDECRNRVPTLSTRGLRGGVQFFDAQMYSSERLVLEIVQAAAMAGAAVLNYVELRGARPEDEGLRIDLQDVLSGDRLETRARFLVNAVGPWLPETLGAAGGDPVPPRYAVALNLVVPHDGGTAAVALSSREEGPRADVRRLFVVPWRGRSLIGTAHYHVEGEARPDIDPEPWVQRFLAEINQARPGAPVARDEVLRVHFGLLPVKEGSGDASRSLLRAPLILKHARPILSVASVKYTGARALAERVVDEVFRHFGWSPPTCRTRSTPLPGAPTTSVSEVLRTASQDHGHLLDADVLEHLVRVYGRRYEDLVRLVRREPETAARVVPEKPVLVAQLEYGARWEMAALAEDLLDRRTEIGAIGAVTPGAVAVAERSVLRNRGAGA